MVKLAELVRIANNAKTDEQRNAVGEELKKIIRGKKACDPKQQLFSNVGIKIERGQNLRRLGSGAYGAVFYGCLDNECKTGIAIKVTTEPSARVEYRIAEKLRGMGVPRVYHFKSCDDKDVLYFEYIKGQTLEKWLRSKPSSASFKRVISQVIGNLEKIHNTYPSFRHHDLHWNNIIITENLKPIMIDFGLATIEGVRNPDVTSGSFNNSGISTKSHYMYDAHYFLNIIHRYTTIPTVKKFIEDVLTKGYIGRESVHIKDMRLRLGQTHDELPTYNDILKHPFLGNKSVKIILKPTSRKVETIKPKQLINKNKKETSPVSAIKRAMEVLRKEAEKRTKPLKRAIFRTSRDPSVMSQVRAIEKKVKSFIPPVRQQVISSKVREIQTKIKLYTQNPKVFINKNGDIKIDKRKCHLYKKEDLVKLFKLDPRLTKDQMCKLIKNM